MRTNQRAFTLIEILVVVGIIVILVGLLVMGFRHIGGQTAMKETIAELKICTGMLTEYSAHSGLNNIESGVAAAPAVADPNAASPGLFPVYFWLTPPSGNIVGYTPPYYQYTYSTAATANTYWPCLQTTTVAPDQFATSGTPGTDDFTVPGTSSADLGYNISANVPRYACQAVKKTRDIFYLLLRVPANRTVFQSVQSKRVLEDPTHSTTIDKGAVLLDGWNNPIIYVPRGGMHTWIQNPTTNSYDRYLVRSSGMVPVAAGMADPPMTGAERPFFASAGPDGDFTLGLDNVYSFQQ